MEHVQHVQQQWSQVSSCVYQLVLCHDSTLVFWDRGACRWGRSKTSRGSGRVTPRRPPRREGAAPRGHCCSGPGRLGREARSGFCERGCPVLGEREERENRQMSQRQGHARPQDGSFLLASGSDRIAHLRGQIYDEPWRARLYVSKSERNEPRKITSHPAGSIKKRSSQSSKLSIL